MFLARRPSTSEIDRFLRHAADLPLSYGPIGIAIEPRGRRLDETTARIGRGRADFKRARAAIEGWKQCNLGWVETFPSDALVSAGTVVAVLIRHLGFWSLNSCRVLYHVGGPGDETRFGFAYGTLTAHAEGGEELFEIFMDPVTEDVMYRIRATSWPRAVLARIGQPIVRVLQARFREHSTEAMRRAIDDSGGRA